MDRALPSEGRSCVGSILTSLTNAGVAHLEERVPPKNQAAGSSPVTAPFWGCSTMDSASSFYLGGCEFDSRQPHQTLSRGGPATTAPPL